MTFVTFFFSSVILRTRSGMPRSARRWRLARIRACRCSSIDIVGAMEGAGGSWKGSRKGLTGSGDVMGGGEVEAVKLMLPYRVGECCSLIHVERCQSVEESGGWVLIMRGYVHDEASAASETTNHSVVCCLSVRRAGSPPPSPPPSLPPLGLHVLLIVLSLQFRYALGTRIYASRGGRSRGGPQWHQREMHGGRGFWPFRPA